MAFKQGNNIGAATRFQPGQSGNPGGRPKGMAAIAHKVMAEAVAEGDMTRAEALVRKLFELAMEGNVQAIKLLLDREWPAPNRHEIAGADGGALQVEIEAAARELDRLLAPHLESEATAEH